MPWKVVWRYGGGIAALLLFLAFLAVPDRATFAATVALETDFEFDAETGTITKYKRHYFFGTDSDIIIPATIGGVEVRAIGSSAFQSSRLTSVTIPDGVTDIGGLAFYECSRLASVVLPNGVANIGSLAFGDCDCLTSVTIPGSVTNMEGAFSVCSRLASVAIQDGVTSIGRSAFGGCSSLSGVVIPGSVTNIGDHVFYGCSSLTRVQYGGSRSDWGSVTIGEGNRPLVCATVHCTDGDVEAHAYAADIPDESVCDG